MKNCTCSVEEFTDACSKCRGTGTWKNEICPGCLGTGEGKLRSKTTKDPHCPTHGKEE